MSVLNALLVRYTGGTVWEVDAGSVATYGRREGPLNVPGITTDSQAREVARAVLAAYAHHRVKTTAVHVPASGGEEPFTGYDIGDIVTAPGPDGPAELRVRSITVNEDQDGNLDFVPELGDRVEEFEATLARFLARFGTAPQIDNAEPGGGSGGGDTPSADDPPITFTEPDPVPPYEPWIDPTLTDPVLNGTSTIGNQDPTNPEQPDPIDPGQANVFATVIVPGPEESPGGGGLDDPAFKLDQDALELGPETELKVKGPEEHSGDELHTGHTGLAGVYELLEDYANQNAGAGSPPTTGIIKAASARRTDPNLGLIWDGIRSFFGRVSGRPNENAVTIDGDGNWVFGQDGISRPAIDFSNADVSGITPPGQKAVLRYGKTGRLRTSTFPIPPATFDYAINVYRIQCSIYSTGSGLVLNVNLGGTTVTFSGSGSDTTGWALAANDPISVLTGAGGVDNLGALVEIFYTY